MNLRTKRTRGLGDAVVVGSNDYFREIACLAGALKNMLEQPKTGTDEVAVMIDARYPVEIAPLPAGVERLDYVNSWKTKA